MFEVVFTIFFFIGFPVILSITGLDASNEQARKRQEARDGIFH